MAQTRDQEKPCICFTAGVHGDEPAAPWALHGIVADRLLDRRFAYRFFVCTNPSGYVAGTRHNADGRDINRSFEDGGTTPEAHAIVTANRERTFAAAIDMHEDYEGDGFYCYVPMGDPHRIGARIIEALDDAALPVQALGEGFDLGGPAGASHALQIARGCVQVDHAEERRIVRGLPFSVYVMEHTARYAMTCESPGTQPWEMRLAAHRVAIVTALATLADAQER